ncbi:DNA-directed DNA polymerase [Reticulomyxa filosa]|uniref:DNA-directed DNA polymerase n=1 Tax=Reticulomyxa filosa TaxID=46433 RepID=X6PDV2_RETFI|nr:DNA-directed DNA polymerase [Reticulomyxa filosa]|eukprot:ETO36361.1 DNA-directed DNA polymerase [Reticulomyxa filosa]
MDKLYELPAATITRLMKEANPNVTISKKAKETISKAAGIFALYLAFKCARKNITIYLRVFVNVFKRNVVSNKKMTQQSTTLKSANETARERKRQTIQTEDVINALHDCDFGNMVPNVEAFLNDYSNQQKDKKQKKQNTNNEKNGDNEKDLEKEEEKGEVEEAEKVEEEAEEEQKQDDNDNELATQDNSQTL